MKKVISLLVAAAAVLLSGLMISSAVAVSARQIPVLRAAAMI